MLKVSSAKKVSVIFTHPHVIPNLYAFSFSCRTHKVNVQNNTETFSDFHIISVCSDIWVNKTLFKRPAEKQKQSDEASVPGSGLLKPIGRSVYMID